MAATLVVLAAAVAVVALVLVASSRAERRPRLEGRPLRREPHSHLNIDGRPKMAFTTREAADAAAEAQSRREGRVLRAYACRDPRCHSYHIGHG